MPILLNAEEIRNCWPAGQRKGYTPTPFDYVIRQAQLKKVVEVGNKKCLDSLGCIDIYKLYSFWQSLKKEAGIT